MSALALVLATTVRAEERNRQSVQLPNASTAVVSAIAIDVTTLSLTDLETVPIAAVTPDQTDAALAPHPDEASGEYRDACVGVGAAGVIHRRQEATPATRLPQTISALPLIVLLSVASIGVAFGLMTFDRRRRASAA